MENIGEKNQVLPWSSEQVVASFTEVGNTRYSGALFCLLLLYKSLWRAYQGSAAEDWALKLGLLDLLGVQIWGGHTWSIGKKVTAGTVC